MLSLFEYMFGKVKVDDFDDDNDNEEKNRFVLLLITMDIIIQIFESGLVEADNEIR